MKMSFLFTGDRKTAPYVYFIVRLLVFQCKVSSKDADAIQSRKIGIQQ